MNTAIEHLIRPNIRNLAPYSSARSEFSGKALLCLDANENPFDIGYGRYPDSAHGNLRSKMSKIKGIEPEYIFTGNGSDEIIDLLIRVFCEPAIDNIVSITPSYGMYKVEAAVNNVEFREVELTEEGFELSAETVLNATDEHTKLIFLCSPNNPTGNLLCRQEINVIMKEFKGILVIDEAYIDFAPAKSLLMEVKENPHLTVIQTLSKAWGAAGLRIGMAFADPEIISVLDRVKHPYNLGQVSQTFAIQRLFCENKIKEQLEEIITERDTLADRLKSLSYVERVYPSDANFLLVKFKNANAVYKHLIEKKIVVRNRSSMPLCDNCLRITVGMAKDNKFLFEMMKSFVD